MLFHGGLNFSRIKYCSIFVISVSGRQPLNFESVPYARCIELIKRGALLACNEPARTEETEAMILWPAEPLFIARSLIYARTPAKQSGLTAASLEGKTVAVTNGYEYGSSFDSNKKIKREVVIKEISVFRMLTAN